MTTRSHSTSKFSNMPETTRAEIKTTCAKLEQYNNERAKVTARPKSSMAVLSGNKLASKRAKSKPSNNNQQKAVTMRENIPELSFAYD